MASAIYGTPLYGDAIYGVTALPVALAGNQPAATGTVVARRLLSHITLTGNQPAATGVVVFLRPSFDWGYTPMVGVGRVRALPTGRGRV